MNYDIIEMMFMEIMFLIDCDINDKCDKVINRILQLYIYEMISFICLQDI